MSKLVGFDAFLSKMKKFSVTCRENIPFARLTTFQSGGTIKLTVYPDTLKKLVVCVRLLRKYRVRYCVLGMGSNTLASDGYYDGVVVVTTGLKGVKLRGNYAEAQCGASAVAFSRRLREHGLSGGEFFACLPASVGGAVVCNAGCFGQSVSDVLKSALVLYKGELHTLKARSCRFGKRTSLFKNNGDYVVLSAKFRFTHSTEEQVSAKIDKMRQKKAQTQPLNKPSAGCALYHDKIPVSKYIDMAGLKGYAVGGAEVSCKHAGFVVNNGNATSAQIIAVIEHVEQTLYERFGITAKREITLINFGEEQ